MAFGSLYWLAPKPILAALAASTKVIFSQALAASFSTASLADDKEPCPNLVKWCAST